MKRTNVDGFRTKIAAMYRPFDPCIVGSIVLCAEMRNETRTTTTAISIVDIDPSLFS